MIATRGTRVVVTLVSIAVVGGSLAGCAHTALGGAQAHATGTSAPSAQASSSGSSDSTLSSIQGDLNSANSATDNASGDVADADRSAATSDSP